MAKDDGVAGKRVFSCSFCRKPQTDVEILISGPGVFICNECVALTARIVAEQPTPTSPRKMLPDDTPTETLLKSLSAYNDTFEAVGAGMQDLVDILRERGVAWAVIGEKMGVSRQAVWKRFA